MKRVGQRSRHPRRGGAMRLVREQMARQWRAVTRELRGLRAQWLREERAEAERELGRLRRVRGASYRTWRRMGRAAAVVVVAGALLGVGAIGYG